MKYANQSKVRRTQDQLHQRSLSSKITGLDFEKEKAISNTKRQSIGQVYKQTQQDVYIFEQQQIKQEQSTGNKSYKNQSSLTSGFIIEGNGKRFGKDMKSHLRNSSSVFAPPEPNTQKSRPIKKQGGTVNPEEENTLGIRNPISGVNCQDKDSIPVRQRGQFTPSQEQSRLNMRKYMMQGEMQTLQELQRQDGRKHVNNNTFKSQVFLGHDPNYNSTPSQPEKTQGFGKYSGYEEKERCKRMSQNRNTESMGDILKYKDALQYRDDYHSTKIADESYQDKLKHTLQNVIEHRMGSKMTKAKELSSALY